MKTREPGPRFREKSLKESERIEYMRETLESPGWKYILDLFLADAANTRKRVFGLTDQTELVTELKTLRLLKASLGRVYTEVGYKLPDKASAIFE
jgi:hypothetical protein